MEPRANEAFQEFLLARLEGNDKTIQESIPNVIPEIRIELNRKFVALRVIEKIFSNLPQLLSSPRELLLKEEEPIKSRKFAGCEIIRKIGHGGMGVVYLAKQEKLGREVVVKVLRPFATDSESLKQRFQRESRIIGHLDHENIVPVYDIGEEDGACFIVMKYVEGAPLSQILEKMARLDKANIELKDLSEILRECLGKPPSEKIQLAGKNLTEFFCTLIIKMANAVQYVHEHGVVHRDIKPSNIILKADGTPVLVDFGLSQDEIEQSLTLSGEFLGTPIYAAPESFLKKESHNNYQLDVYSLGVTLYELLTGGLPYEGDSIYEIYSNIKNKEPIPPKHFWKSIPRDLETIILTAISKDTGRRYQSVREFSEDLQNFLNYRPIIAKPPSFFYQSVKYIVRNRKAAAAVVGICLTAGIIIGGYYYNRYQKAKQIQSQVQAHLGKGEIDDALGILREATTLFPKRSEAWFHLGQLQLSVGNYQDGIKNIQRALSIEENPSYYTTLAVAHLYAGEMKNAEEALNSALAKTPQDYGVLSYKGLLESLRGQLEAAVSFFKKVYDLELKGLNGEERLTAAFLRPAAMALAILFKEMGYRNIAKKYVYEGVLLAPYNVSYVKFLKQLPLNISEKRILGEAAQTEGAEQLDLYGHPLHVKVPVGWLKGPFNMLLGKEALAVYQAPPLGTRDFLVSPTIIIFYLGDVKNPLDRAYIVLDRIVSQFKGGTLKRSYKQILNHSFKRYSIEAEVSVPLVKLRAKSLIVEHSGQFYLVAGYAQEDSFQEYEKDILSVMNSVRFYESDGWNAYYAPTRTFSVKMPGTPFYFQKYYGTSKNNLREHVLVSDITGYTAAKFQASQFVVESKFKGKKPKEVFDILLGELRKKGKVLNHETIETHEYPKLKVTLRIGKLVAAVESYFLGGDIYVLEVDQDSETYDDSMAENFFKSFNYVGEEGTQDRSTNRKKERSPEHNYLWNYFRLYHKAMAVGDPNAQNELGKHYLNMRDEKGGNLQEALTWFQKAADQGYARSMNNLGLMYENGWAVEQSSDKALAWYRKAAEAGVDIAQYNLGRIYENGAPGIDVNLKEADYWYGKYLQTKFP